MNAARCCLSEGQIVRPVKAKWTAVAGAGKGDKGERVLRGDRFSLRKAESCGDGCWGRSLGTVHVLNTTSRELKDG